MAQGWWEGGRQQCRGLSDGELKLNLKSMSLPPDEHPPSPANHKGGISAMLIKTSQERGGVLLHEGRVYKNGYSEETKER